MPLVEPFDNLNPCPMPFYQDPSKTLRYETLEVQWPSIDGGSEDEAYEACKTRLNPKVTDADIAFNQADWPLSKCHKTPRTRVDPLVGLIIH